MSRNTLRNLFGVKGRCHEIFDFHESVSPKPLSVLLGQYRIFQKFVEIFELKVHQACGKWKTIFNQKSFKYFVLTPLEFWVVDLS
jgi:hypothetical protein